MMNSEKKDPANLRLKKKKKSRPDNLICVIQVTFVSKTSKSCCEVYM